MPRKSSSSEYVSVPRSFLEELLQIVREAKELLRKGGGNVKYV